MKFDTKRGDAKSSAGKAAASKAGDVKSARFAYEGLDRVIHERARLSILTSLISSAKGLTFNDLKLLCALTDGNLSRHLRVLEEARIVEIVKGHDHNRSQTVCRITSLGRTRFLEYLSTLEQVVKDAAEGKADKPAFLGGLAPSKG
jgi:DNA-binding HxlR family transcriptional regulator